MLTAMRLPSLLILTAMLSFGLAGCPGPSWPKCESDEHCKSSKEGNPSGRDFMCVFGQCQECAKDPDCGDGQRCEQGRCESFCSSDAQCGDGLRCDDAGDCVEQTVSQNENACIENGDCKTGFTCRAGSCVEQRVTTTEPACERSGRVQFDFNVYDLTPEARELLSTFAGCLKKNGDWMLTIEGHADERGTTQYNLDLGEKRARAVRSYLADLGVEGGRLKTISYGEERPLSTTSDEDGWAQNRRGELVIKLR